ncbi:MAG: hypothetical protein C6H99_02430 [Epsilonproteobacteria bacterium]|nr:hypothetical protein [Campylobacterota bacterium]
MALFGFSATISETMPLRIEALEFEQDGVLLISIQGGLVGTQADTDHGDLVRFVVYDDGRIIAKKDLLVPLDQAIQIQEYIKIEGNLSQASPGVAIESKELGIYIDPLLPKSMPGYSEDYLHRDFWEYEYNDTCHSLAKFGFICEGI